MSVVGFPSLEICNNRVDVYLALNALGVVYKETEWTKIAITRTHTQIQGCVLVLLSQIVTDLDLKTVYILPHPSAESKSEPHQSQKKLGKLAKSHLPVLGVPASCHQEDVLDIDGPPSSEKRKRKMVTESPAAWQMVRGFPAVAPTRLAPLDNTSPGSWCCVMPRSGKTGSPIHSFIRLFKNIDQALSTCWGGRRPTRQRPCPPCSHPYEKMQNKCADT